MCECEDGYQVSYDNSTNDKDWNICHPVCDAFDDCENGTCVAPNVCQCFEGFLLSDNNYTCIFNSEALTKSSGSNVLLWLAVAMLCVLAAAIGYVTYQKYYSDSYMPNYVEREYFVIFFVLLLNQK